ncbi:MAG: hypothetical protein E5V25_27540, partial [Mesorhizobium sp.]
MRSRHHAECGARAQGARGDQQRLRLRRHQCGAGVQGGLTATGSPDTARLLATRRDRALAREKSRPGVSMTDLSAFPIATRWPASHPDRI